MKIFSWFEGYVGRPAARLAIFDERKAAWPSDPLSHPAIELMSERELADLPFRQGACSTRFEGTTGQSI